MFSYLRSPHYLVRYKDSKDMVLDENVQETYKLISLFSLPSMCNLLAFCEKEYVYIEIFVILVAVCLVDAVFSPCFSCER